MIWCGLKIKENCHILVNQFHGNIHSKTLGYRKIKSVFRDVKWCFNASWGLKGFISQLFPSARQFLTTSSSTPYQIRLFVSHLLIWYDLAYFTAITYCFQTLSWTLYVFIHIHLLLINSQVLLTVVDVLIYLCTQKKSLFIKVIIH